MFEMYELRFTAKSPINVVWENIEFDKSQIVVERRRSLFEVYFGFQLKLKQNVWAAKRKRNENIENTN